MSGNGSKMRHPGPATPGHLTKKQVRLQEVDEENEHLLELCQQLIKKKKKKCHIVTFFKNPKDDLMKK